MAERLGSPVFLYDSASLYSRISIFSAVAAFYPVIFMSFRQLPGKAQADHVARVSAGDALCFMNVAVQQFATIHSYIVFKTVLPV